MFYYVTSTAAKGNNVDLITINIAKAFYSISHKNLIHILFEYGIAGNRVNWRKLF